MNFSAPQIDLRHGDSIHVLKEIESNSVDAVVTDPPYGLAFMNKHWDYDIPSVDLWREVLRVLKPGGHVLSFGGTRTYHRMVVNIEDAGFEIRDQIQWIYGSGFPKSHNLKDDFKGWGTALKPANEPICVARKPIVGTVADNVLRWGTGALNIDWCRIGMQSAMTYTAPDITGNAFNSDISSRERKTISVPAQGRWPANVLFDEAAAEMLDAQSGTIKSGKPGIKTQGNNGAAYGAESRPPGTLMSGFGDSGGASRFFYVAKASKRERNAGLEGMSGKRVSHMITGSGKPSESVKERSAEGEPNRFTATHQNFHPTVKPIKLMEYLCKLITPPNGVILDPFMGSGSTGVAAKNLNFKFIGIEREKEYCEIAQKRMEALDGRR